MKKEAPRRSSTDPGIPGHDYFVSAIPLPVLITSWNNVKKNPRDCHANLHFFYYETTERGTLPLAIKKRICVFFISIAVVACAVLFPHTDDLYISLLPFMCLFDLLLISMPNLVFKDTVYMFC